MICNLLNQLKCYELCAYHRQVSGITSTLEMKLISLWGGMSNWNLAHPGRILDTDEIIYPLRIPQRQGRWCAVLIQDLSLCNIWISAFLIVYRHYIIKGNVSRCYWPSTVFKKSLIIYWNYIIWILNCVVYAWICLW